MAEDEDPKGFIVAVVRLFLTGPLSLIFLALAALLGLMAVFMTPREEEPQIVVPMADLAVSFPGHSAAEVEQLVTTPLERLLWQVDGVEHVYSVSRRDAALVTVRFFVGQDRDRAMTRINDKISANLGIVPPGVSGWTVSPVEIDDVPVVTLTLYSNSHGPYELRRVAEELKARLDSSKDVSKTSVVGGLRREMRILPDIEEMAARGVTLGDIAAALSRNNLSVEAGFLPGGNGETRLLSGPALASAADVKATVLKTSGDGLVRLEDVAEVVDGPELPEDYVSVGFGPAAKQFKDYQGRRFPAVTVAFSKKKGTNAVQVADSIIKKAEELKPKLFPSGMEMLVTRDYGKIADDKVNDLITSMVFAVLTVVGLIAFTMGWREGLVVGVSIPASFALALFVNYISGYTINRVTLFALILSLGLVVDDPITNVDNIQRHIRMGLVDPFRATLRGVHEVIVPVIMSTLAIIMSFAPLFFITGMMGPYMAPMAINVPLTVTFSTVCALTFVPWLAYHLLKGKAGDPSRADDVTPEWIRRGYRAVMSPFLVRRNALLLFAGVFAALLLSGWLMLFKVPLKMLPFDNKNELQVLLDMPEGTSLEATNAVVKRLEGFLERQNEVTNFESYVGVPSPIDFNGLVRHYGNRTMPNLADIRVNLADKTRRAQQSHAIALRLRDELTALAAAQGGLLSLVEIPPGPPVMATVTVEVHGDPDLSYDALIAGAKDLETKMRATAPKTLAQIDDMSETPRQRLTFKVDRTKAALNGLDVSGVAAELRKAVAGAASGFTHVEGERSPLFNQLRLPLLDRASPERLGQLWLRGSDGKMLQLSELGGFVSEPEDQPIYHKNLDRVVFVTAEAVGRPPGELILEVWKKLWADPLPSGIRDVWDGEGEWEITLRVFRDLGIAFGVALIGIYLLMVLQTGSFFMPLVIMCAIPLTIIGIAPGFYLLNLLTGKTVAGYADGVFFTATAMIGMIALGGIVIRNSIVLIEFIQDAVAEGKSLEDAILSSGAVRFRPIALTALTTLMGAWPITLDPIFSGLAWALIFGLLASTMFTMVVIPAVYMLVAKARTTPTPLGGN